MKSRVNTGAANSAKLNGGKGLRLPEADTAEDKIKTQFVFKPGKYINFAGFFL
jgi:hypothetical protein